MEMIATPRAKAPTKKTPMAVSLRSSPLCVAAPMASETIIAEAMAPMR